MGLMECNMKTAWMPVLILLATTALAEEPARDTETILARLQDPRPSEIAWGAYLAGEKGVKDAIPHLVRHLRPDPIRSGEAWALVDRALLDALIRLDAKVPAEVLVPRLHTDRRVLALILIGREPTRNRGLLLDRYDRGLEDPGFLDIGTVAVGNLLAGSRAPGFAVRVMRRAPTRLTIHVREPGRGTVGLGSSFSVGSGDGHRRIPEGYPPYVVYEFREAGPRSRDKLFAHGPHPIVYRRTSRRGTRIGTGFTRIRYDRAEVLNGWIAAMIGTKPSLVRIPRREVSTVHFTRADGYLAEAVRARDAILKTYWFAARRLLDRKLLTLAEAKSLEFSVTVAIEDEREDRSVALPPLPATTVAPDWPDE